jgi:hypothetical protein
LGERRLLAGRRWSSSCWFASEKEKQRGDEWRAQTCGAQRRGEVLWLLRWRRTTEGRETTDCSGSLRVEGKVERRGVRVFKEIGTKELDYFSGDESNSKVLNREAGKHCHNSNESGEDLNH